MILIKSFISRHVVLPQNHCALFLSQGTRNYKKCNFKNQLALNLCISKTMLNVTRYKIA
jgi:hypothetical protein